MASGSSGRSERSRTIALRFWGFLLPVMLVTPLAPVAAAQATSSYVLVTSGSSSGEGLTLAAFDRRLELVNELAGTGGSTVATAPEGTRWVGVSATSLLHLDVAARPQGTLTVPPSYRPPAVDAKGRVVIATSSSLTSWSPNGAPIWSVPLPTGLWETWLAVDTAGTVHVGGSLESTTFWGGPSGLFRYSSEDGAQLGSLTYPPDEPSGDHWILQVRGAPDGTVWCNDGMYNPEPIYYVGATMLNASSEAVVDSVPFGADGDMGGYSTGFCVDGHGRLLMPDYDWVGGVSGHPPVVPGILRVDPSQPATPASSWELGNDLLSFELGSTGEELFAVTRTPISIGAPFTWRLVRLNLVSGAKSSIALGTTAGPSPSSGIQHWLLRGDPTGFMLASSVDRTGDADSDGALNGDETAAGSDWFDPESRPDGPKVYVSFAPGTNAIEMTLFDPDGLRHPTKGIDFGTMSVTIGDSGNVFWPLLSLVTEASLSADGQTAHAVFGGLPLASDLKLRVEMSVRDRTGAVGWDWQATPPGDL